MVIPIQRQESDVRESPRDLCLPDPVRGKIRQYYGVKAPNGGRNTKETDETTEKKEISRRFINSTRVRVGI